MLHNFKLYLSALIIIAYTSHAGAQTRVTTYFEDTLYTYNHELEMAVPVAKKLVKERYFITTDSVKDGLYQCFYFKTFDVHKECMYRIGKIEGEMKEFYAVQNSEGKPMLKKSIAYENGIMHGPVREYHPTGELKTQYEHRQGIITGLLTEYQLDGTVSMKAQYNAQGRPDTVWHYYPSGALSLMQPYKDGLAEGANMYYYESGKVKQTKPYVAGQLTGKIISYDTTGRITKTAEFDSDRQHGVTLLYHADGTLKEEINYKNDRKHGAHKTYYSTGNLQMEAHYRNNQPTDSLVHYRPGGVPEKKWLIKADSVRFYTFHSSGSLHQEGLLCRGKLEGENRGYYPGGEPEYRYVFAKGEKIGLNEEYFIDGKPRKTEYVKPTGQKAVTYFSDGRVSKKEKMRKQPVFFHSIHEYGATGNLLLRERSIGQRKKSVSYDKQKRKTHKRYFKKGKKIKEVIYFYPPPPLPF